MHCINMNPAGNNTVPSAGRKIQFIVVHYTATAASDMGNALRIAQFFGQSTENPSADFVVDNELVVQFNPDLGNRCCKHCGGGPLSGLCTNENSIGIELCSENTAKEITYPGDPRYSFTDAVLENAAELIRHLMAEYHIDLSRVVRHYDVSGKLCPGVPGWYGPEAPCWTEFKKCLLPADQSGRSR